MKKPKSYIKIGKNTRIVKTKTKGTRTYTKQLSGTWTLAGWSHSPPKKENSS